MTRLRKQMLQLVFVVGLAHLMGRAAGFESGRADGSDVVQHFMDFLDPAHAQICVLFVALVLSQLRYVHNVRFGPQ